jgi:hypothetical protein
MGTALPLGTVGAGSVDAGQPDRDVLDPGVRDAPWGEAGDVTAALPVLSALRSDRPEPAAAQPSSDRPPRRRATITDAAAARRGDRWRLRPFMQM